MAAQCWIARTIVFVSLCMAAGPVSADPMAWRDAATGFAIGGYDPVAYFTQRAPVRGDRAYQWHWLGTSWAFSNPGNLAAFRRHSEVYAPQYSGYDVTGIADGRLLQGLPSIWSVHDGKLYLFYSPVSKRLWDEDRTAMLTRAAERWKTLARDLPNAPK